MEDSDYEEERVVIMVELQGVFDPEVLLNKQDAMKVLGLDTDEPAIQIGNCIFSGQYENTPGTTVFFQKPTDENRAAVCCKTDKKLTMKRVFLEKKCQISEPSAVISGLELGSGAEIVSILEVNSSEKHKPSDTLEDISIPGTSGLANNHEIDHQLEPEQFQDMDTAISEVVVDVVTSGDDDILEDAVMAPEVCENLDNTADNEHSISNHSSEDAVSNMEESNARSNVEEIDADYNESAMLPVSYCMKKRAKVESSSDAQNATSSNEVDNFQESSVSNSLQLIPAEDQSVAQGLNLSNIADSASHLISQSVHVSDSSFPTVCDSASGSATGRRNVIEHGFDFPGPSNESPSSVQHISTSNSLSVSSRNDGDSGEEPMDIVVDDTNSENGTAEALCVQPRETLEDEVSGSQALGFEDGNAIIETGSSVNSTVSEVGNLAFNDGNEAGSSNNFAYSQSTKDSVDSTSNQVYQSNRHPRNYESYKSVSGIDSTTNEMNEGLLSTDVDSPMNLTVASSSGNINDNIDSSLSNSAAEYVDFEMREAGNVGSVEEDNGYNERILDANHSIDSTSNIVGASDSHSHNQNVNNESSNTLQPCEVSESCSINFPTNQASESQGTLPSFVMDNEHDENSRVTESHIDDNVVLFPSVQEHDNLRPNNTVSESLHFEESEAAMVEESSDNENSSSLASNVLALCSSSKIHVSGSSESPRPGPSHVAEFCSSSNKSIESSLEIEQRVIRQVVESSKQLDSSNYESESPVENRSNQVTASCEAEPRRDNNADGDLEALVVDDTQHGELEESPEQPHSYVMEAERRLILMVPCPEQDDNEVTESVASCSNVIVESEYSEADALNQVTDSQEVVTSRDQCASSSEQLSPRADSNVLYSVSEIIENEVSESGSSNLRRNLANESNEPYIEDDDIIIIVPSPRSLILLESCVSSNDQSVADSERPQLVMVDPDMSAEMYDNDSRPSSSKEVTRTSTENVYEISDSPEAESPNDPCSSSSNKPNFSPSHVSSQIRASESEDPYNEEMSACCSTSDSHQNLGYSEATFPSEAHQQNEDEVSESCAVYDGPQTYEISESSMDNEGILYIDTDSPDAGACVSESCASSSNHYMSRAQVQEDPLVPMDYSAEVSESCHSFQSFSTMAPGAEERLDNSPVDMPEDLSQNRGEIQCSVSDSTDVCHATHSVSPGLEHASDIQDDDNDSLCEVSESHIQNTQNVFRQPTMGMNPSPSSSDGASTSHGVVSSRHWKVITTSTRQDSLSNDVRVSSASDLRSWPGNSIRVSSASDVSQLNNAGDSTTNGDDQPSASGHEMLNVTDEISGNEVADSYDENPADSTEDGDIESRRNRYDDQPPEGSDNSKLPSSTSN